MRGITVQECLAVSGGTGEAVLDEVTVNGTRVSSPTFYLGSYATAIYDFAFNMDFWMMVMCGQSPQPEYPRMWIDGVKVTEQNSPASMDPDLGAVLKPGVSLDGLQPEMVRVFSDMADAVRTATGTMPMVTSGSDSHSTGMHPIGQAMDWSTKTANGNLISDAQGLALADSLRASLAAQYGAGTYDVVFHTMADYQAAQANGTAAYYPHLHVEYDPRPGH